MELNNTHIRKILRRVTISKKSIQLLCTTTDISLHSNFFHKLVVTSSFLSRSTKTPSSSDSSIHFVTMSCNRMTSTVVAFKAAIDRSSSYSKGTLSNSVNVVNIYLRKKYFCRFNHFLVKCLTFQNQNAVFQAKYSSLATRSASVTIRLSLNKSCDAAR